MKPTTETAAQKDSAAGPDTGGYVDYLRLNRDFTAKAVAAAVASIRVAEHDRPLRVLDAGTGAGGAVRHLAGLVRRAGQGGRVTAVDVDGRAVEVAQDQIGDPELERLVDLRVADLRGFAADEAATTGGFDVIWSSDVVWPATFEDPAAVVRTLADALVPGGVLALFTTNYYQSIFLPGHSRLERLIRTASELTWDLPQDGPAHYERLGAWMRLAGLDEVALRVFPVAAPVWAERAARAYLERIVWPEMRHAVASHGRAVGMTEADLSRAEELLDPAGPGYVGADRDTFVVQPALLWTGRASVAVDRCEADPVIQEA